MKLAILAILAAACTGCLASAPLVPVTPQNQAQVTACENTAATHNVAVISDFVFTGSAGTLGAVAALEPNVSTKNAVDVGAAVSGGLAVLASSIVALSANNFANDQCSGLVGNLPVATGVQ